MLAPQDENDNQVRREDQNRINQFSRLNTRKHQIQSQVQAHQQDLDRLEDAATDLMMGESSTVWMQLGDAWLQVSEDEATEHCEGKVEELQSKIDALRSEEKDILVQHEGLKKELYGRFGKSINLEDS